MASDETSICNLALGMLGQTAIMSLDDESKAARTCKQFYAATRDSVLQGHEWTFAINRKSLARLSETPSEDWAYQFQLPSDYLQIVSINSVRLSQLTGYYAIEGRKLLTDSSEVRLRYVARIEDANLYHPLFVEAMATKLAVALAKPLTGSTQEKQSLLTEYIRITGPDARAANAVEGKPRPVMPWEASYLVASRRGGRF